MSLLFLETTLQTYANELIGLKRADGKKNFFVVSDPENAESAIQAARNQLGWPCLLLEFPDQQYEENTTADFVIIPLSLCVIKFNNQQENGVESIKNTIYTTCEPLLAQIIARFKKEAKAKTLKYNCAPIVFMPRIEGQWIGPIINTAHGYRYSFEIRVVKNPFKFEPTNWQ